MSIDKDLTVYPIQKYLPATRKVLEARGKEPELPIVSLPNLNKKIWGLSPSKMTIIGARTSVGKTAFAMQVAYDLAHQGHPVLYLSFEMKYDELIERIFVHRYKINNFDLLSGGFPKYQQQWADFENYLKDTRLVITDGFARKWQELDAFLDSLETVPKVIILDYIQAISQSSMEGKGFIDEYIRHFRELCAYRNFAGVILSQVNRSNPDARDKTPQLHQLKGSGFLEEHADVVILLDWPCKHTKNTDPSKYHIHVAKNRTGRTGYMELKYIPETYTFEDIEDIREEQLDNINRQLQRADIDD
jgi:replicative DNA helicase